VFFGCTGSGTVSGVIAGVDWVRINHILPAVINMSLGGGFSVSLNTAVKDVINAGVTTVVSAGNDGANACAVSPASVPQAITVAASDINDVRAGFSNTGTCVDIFAPGVNIVSASNASDTAQATFSGTSQAAPHVTGVAAIYLMLNPFASPAQVWTAIKNAAVPNKITSPGTGTPNLLVQNDP